MELTINGRKHQVDVPADMPLLWVLRDVVGLTGTKFGCGMSLCGACTVHLDGQPIRSCTTPVSAVAGKHITTIFVDDLTEEMDDANLHSLVHGVTRLEQLTIAYGAERRPVAQQVLALADRLTRLATVRPALRAWRNLVLSALARLPVFRRKLAWQLSGLVYR